jgi:hypothetical protein
MPSRMFHVTGAREVAASFDELGLLTRAQLAAETKAAARELQATVRANASTGYHSRREGHIPGTGPGPNVVTGAYLHSIQVRDNEAAFIGGVLSTSSVVYTDAPQADRLEYGFHGVDSLGRHYRQQAYPHWGPAVEVVEREYLAAVEEAVNTAIAGLS